jgi:hypothetical protein
MWQIQVNLRMIGVHNRAFNKALERKAKQSLFTNHTFSGRVSTLKRIRPKQSKRTIANDEHKTKVGFLATHVPYFLNMTIYTQCQNLYTQCQNSFCLYQN